MPPSRLFLADPLLRGMVGHHLGYNLALADAARRAGVAPVLVAHRDLAASLSEGETVERRFRTDWRANPPAWIARRPRLLDALERWCDHRFAVDIAGLSAAENDAVFAQMLAPRHFRRWLQWLGRPAAPPVLFLHLGYRPGRFDQPETKRALAGLPGEIRRRVVLVTDSEKLVEPFGQILAAPVHYLPHIISYEFPRPAASRPAGPITVFVPGNARREKGFAEVCRALAELREEPDLRFVVQCHDPDPFCAGIISAGRPESPRIEWIDRPLEAAEYAERLGRADAVMLPYHLDLYAMRTSGIFCEARVSGTPVIASQGSWAGDRVAREGGGWLVAERDEAGLARTLRSLPETLAERSAAARGLVDAARGEFHRDFFMRELLALFAQASSAHA